MGHEPMAIRTSMRALLATSELINGVRTAPTGRQQGAAGQGPRRHGSGQPAHRPGQRRTGGCAAPRKALNMANRKASSGAPVLPRIVLVDANVFFAPRMRDLFMHLHAAEVFRRNGRAT